MAILWPNGSCQEETLRHFIPHPLFHKGQVKSLKAGEKLGILIFPEESEQKLSESLLQEWQCRWEFATASSP